MNRKLLPLFVIPLLAAVAGASVMLRLDMATTTTSQAPEAQLEEGEQGTATIGASGTQANIDLGSLPLLVADDILTIPSTDAGWNVHAQHVGHTGFDGLLETFTLRLDDGTLATDQIVIVAGSLNQAQGTAVDLPTVGGTEVQVIGLGSGTLSFDLVFRPDGSQEPEVRYRVDLTVGA